MPIVRIDLFPGRSDAAKQALADRITAAFAEVCGSNPSDVAVLFSHVPPQDWFVAGKAYAPATPQTTFDRQADKP